MPACTHMHKIRRLEMVTDEQLNNIKDTRMPNQEWDHSGVLSYRNGKDTRRKFTWSRTYSVLV